MKRITVSLLASTLAGTALAHPGTPEMHESLSTNEHFWLTIIIVVIVAAIVGLTIYIGRRKT